MTADSSRCRTVCVAGASGFIGARLVAALRARGHSVVAAVRDPARWSGQHGGLAIALDYRRHPPHASAPAGAALRAQLAAHRVDVLVNAVGIFGDTSGQPYARLHDAGPRELFASAQAAGVARVIQLSALGADDAALTDFHRSKRAADDALLALAAAAAGSGPGSGSGGAAGTGGAGGLQAVVLQPSLVFGPRGASARAMLRWAVAPVLWVPQGAGAIQPVHVDDLAEAVCRLVTCSASAWRSDVPSRLAVVGPAPMTLADYGQALRGSLGLPPSRVRRLPRALVATAVGAARVLEPVVPPLRAASEAWTMLQQGNAADAAPFRQVLGRAPRPPCEFLPADWGRLLTDGLGLQRWRTPVRVSLALVWAVTALVSALVYPREASLALLARSGHGGAGAPLLLAAAVALDALMAVLTLWRPSRLLWAGQIALILYYSAVITFRLPEFWGHPYGPVLKNLPMLAVLGLLWSTETGSAPADEDRPAYAPDEGSP